MALGDDSTVQLKETDPPVSLSAFTVGALVNGRYRVVREIGRGGMGVVYHVVDELMGREVALKMLHAATSSRASLSLFQAEFVTLSSLAHPNIAKVYDFACHERSGRFFFTMELVPGANAAVATEGASVETLCDVALSVLRALSYLHARDVIHLDLKPANILVTRAHDVRVVDFGIARTANTPAFVTHATPAYLAPEVQREGAQIDRRADLYSLGVTLFQLLFQRLPEASQLQNVPSASTSLGLSATEEERAPAWLLAILRRLLDREPARRFRTANEVVRAIAEGSGRDAELETVETRDSYLASAALVGRDHILDGLVDHVWRCGQGRPGPIVAACIGANGLGKSRVLREVRQRCQVARRQFFESQCYRDTIRSFGPWDAIVGQVTTLWPSLAQRYQYVVAQVLPPPAAMLQRPAPLERLGVRALAKALAELLAAVDEPCVVSIDDAQWLDRTSIVLLELVIEQLHELLRNRPAGLAFILASSDDVPPPVLSALERMKTTGALRWFALDPLEHAEIRSLVASMLGTNDIPDALSVALQEVSGGNPELVSEALRVCVQSGHLTPDSTGWTFRDAGTAPEIAAMLLSELNGRFLARPEVQSRVLSVLALYTRPLSIDALSEVLQLSREATMKAALELSREHLVFFSHDDRVSFAVRMWRDRVIEALPDAVRTRIHLRLATALRDSVEVALVALHFELGGDSKSALRCYAQAADSAFVQGDFGRVLRLVDKAIGCGAAGGELGRLCSMAAEAGRLCGERRRAGTFAQRALALLTPGTPEWVQASQVAIATFSPLDDD